MTYSITEGQQVFCPHCGHDFTAPVETFRHAQRGSGSAYTIDHLTEDHELALKALFNLGAKDALTRKPLKAVGNYIFAQYNKLLARNGVGGRLSELQNINIQFVRSYPNKIDRVDDNPTFRSTGRWQGWYLTRLGLDYIHNKITVINGEIKNMEIGDTLSAFAFGTLKVENGKAVEREVVLN